MNDVFISYANADRERVRPLVGVLQAQGWSVWWDREILPGESWDQVIESALTEARCVIVVWTQASVSSRWVRTEAEDARGRNILVPVLLDDVKIPLAFRQIQAANLVGWQGDAQAKGLENLRVGVAAILGEGEQSRAAVAGAEGAAGALAEKERREAEAAAKAEQQRLEGERVEKERREREEAEAAAKAEQVRLAQERTEASARVQKERREREETEAAAKEKQQILRERAEASARVEKERLREQAAAAAAQRERRERPQREEVWAAPAAQLVQVPEQVGEPAETPSDRPRWVLPAAVGVGCLLLALIAWRC